MVDTEKTLVTIACQGGGSHAAYVAGTLQGLLRKLSIEQDQTKARYELLGLSGTSGGAHCALIAWYWMLKDGNADRWEYARAIERLTEFWHNNAPQDIFEQIWDSMVVQAAAAPVEPTLTPYYPPLSTIKSLLGLWPRKAFVDLEALLGQSVDFEDIRVIGDFQKLADEVSHLKHAHIAGALPFGNRAADRISTDLDSLKARCAEANSAVQQLEGFELCKKLINIANMKVLDSYSDDTEKALKDMDGAMQDLKAGIPFLLLGAVNVSDGTFKAFDSRKGEISAKAVLASAAVPWIFKAVKTDGERPWYWDGLFSQNPPTRDFVSGVHDRDRKPDEIWVIQINPQGCEREPVWIDEIQDRRNELTCNLSLNQEIEFLKSVNKWIFEESPTGGSTLKAKRKFIRVHWIRMNSDTLKRELGPVGVASKVERSEWFVDRLISHGLKQSALFWPVRRLVEEVWNGFKSDGTWNPLGLAVLDEILDPACFISLPDHVGIKNADEESAKIVWTGLPTIDGLSKIMQAVEDCHTLVFSDGLWVIVDGMDMAPTTDAGSGTVTIQWRAHVQRGAFEATLTGKAELRLSNHRIVSGRIDPIEIEEIEIQKLDPGEAVASEPRYETIEAILPKPEEIKAMAQPVPLVQMQQLAPVLEKGRRRSRQRPT